MARRIIGLDLGAYSVKLVRLEAGKQHLKFEVVDAIEEVLAPLELGNAENFENQDLLERQREVIAQFSQAGLLENEGASLAVGALVGQMRAMSMPFSDTRKIEAILPGMIEAEVPFELSDMAYTWHRREIGLKEPASQETLIRLAFAKKQSIAAMLQMLQPLAFDPRQMLLGSAALYELIRHLGYEAFVGSQEPNSRASAFIDLGHSATNLCIFDKHGLIFTRSFLLGGEKLTQNIAEAFNISFLEAQNLKHEKIDLRYNFEHGPKDEIAHKLNKIAHAHYASLAHDISRILIASKTNNSADVGAATLVGGAAKALGLDEFYANRFKNLDCKLINLRPLVPNKIALPSMAMAYSLALSGVHVHAKDSRFNFRKDEFAWRGEYDFLRAKSSPLILWALATACALSLMWAAHSLVLGKENRALETQLHAACTEILGKSDVPSRKCLALMKEQISARAEVEIPEFTAADAYLRAAQGLARDLNIIITEMDITEKKVRMTAEAPNYADIDKIIASWAKIPCFVKVENTGAQPIGGKVRFNLSNDIDCQASASTPPAKAQASAAAASVPETTPPADAALAPIEGKK